MDKADQKKLDRARSIASQYERQQEEWEERYEDQRYSTALETRFNEATPPQILDMYVHGVNEDGRTLSRFEFEALCEAWCGAFGDLPPSIGRDLWPPLEHEASDAEEIDATPDDKMLSTSDVVRMTGMSLSTLKRKRAAGLLPAPFQISERRIGWQMRDIRTLLEQMHEDRRGRN